MQLNVRVYVTLATQLKSLKNVSAFPILNTVSPIEETTTATTIPILFVPGTSEKVPEPEPQSELTLSLLGLAKTPAICNIGP